MVSLIILAVIALLIVAGLKLQVRLHRHYALREYNVDKTSRRSRGLHEMIFEPHRPPW